MNSIGTKHHVMLLQTPHGNIHVVRDSVNQSFIEVALALKGLKVSGWYKVLEIKNPQVADIDPFDPDISPEDRMKVMTEAKSNIWYYFREIAKIDLGKVCYGTLIDMLAVIDGLYPTYCIKELDRAAHSPGAYKNLLGLEKRKEDGLCEDVKV